MIGFCPAIRGDMKGIMGPSREELDQAIAASSEAIVVCDPDGRIVGANDRVRALIGYEREDLLTKTLGDLAVPLPNLDGDAALDLETKVRCKDGSTPRLHLSLRSLRMGERSHSVIRIARRRRAADRLPQDPGFVRALLDTPGTLVLSVCREGTICFASTAFQELTGLGFDAMRGRKAWELLPDPADRSALQSAVQQPASRRTLELAWPSAIGAPRRTLWTPTLLSAVPPAPEYLLLVGREMPPPQKSTRRKSADGIGLPELQKRVTELTRELEEARLEQEAFTYTLAHDLRAPLRAMSGFSDTLLEDYSNQPLDETGRNYALRITESAQRMDTLIEDLLVYNRLGRTPVCLAPVPLTNVVADLLRSFSREIRARQARVQVEVPPHDVVADWTMLTLVGSHLLSNALKFVGPGTEPRVKIFAERRDDWIRFVVEDNGIGIPEEYGDRIFGVFQRLNKSEAFSGTGMGLAIVRRAVDRMNGRLGLESQLGKGSRFWVELLAAR